MDGRLRAFLSDRYRRLDNLELIDHVLPVISQMKGCEVVSADITETHLYLKVINKTMKTEIVPGDIVQAGFVVSNSEIGLGALKVEPLVYRLICKNGMISKDYAHRSIIPEDRSRIRIMRMNCILMKHWLLTTRHIL